MGYKKSFCGIYCFINKINGKRYIGQSISINERKDNHINNLLKNKHHSFHLQRAWNKYGIDNFHHEILITCPEEYLNIAETKFINIYKSDDRKYGYNIIKEDRSFSEETRKKMSDSMKKSPLVKQARIDMWKTRKRNKINQYGLDGVFIKTWDTSYDIVRDLKISYSSLMRVCSPKYKDYSAKNYMFRIYLGNTTNIDPYNKYKENYNYKHLFKKNKTTRKIRQVNCYSKITNDLLYTFKNASEASRELKLDSSCISKCCKNKIYYYKQYIFKYKD